VETQIEEFFILLYIATLMLRCYWWKKWH